MVRRTGKAASAFGAALDEHLNAKGMQQADLARATSVSPSYIARLMTDRKVSPEWADLIADTMRLKPAERVTLHFAAARTWGYKLDLTPPKTKK